MTMNWNLSNFTSLQHQILLLGLLEKFFQLKAVQLSECLVCLIIPQQCELKNKPDVHKNFSSPQRKLGA